MPALTSLPSQSIVMVSFNIRARRASLTGKLRSFRILVVNEYILIATSGCDVCAGLKQDTVEPPVPIPWVSVIPACDRPSRIPYRSRYTAVRARCHLRGSRCHLKGMVAVINGCRDTLFLYLDAQGDL